MSFEWCVMLTPEVEGTPRGAMLQDAVWPQHSVIKYAFMDGEAALCDRVCAVANEWITRTGANLILERRNDPNDADVRISFELKGAWSYLGRYAQNVARDEPTMNYGWLTTDSSAEEVREVVLHEFGHALGFIHEHQNPDGGLQWNREAVTTSLSGPPNNWDEDQIRTNVLGTYDPRDLLGTPFDPDSIMLYPFPAEWTTNGISTHNNADLSAKDIALAKRVYT